MGDAGCARPDDDVADTGTDGEVAGPTAPRMTLGVLLRRLREGRGVSREAAGAAIGASPVKVSRLELGRTGVRLRDVVALCGLYGVDDQLERATLVGLAKQASVPVWWQTYGDVVPGWFEPYLGFEDAASLIRTYEVQFIPGLLQTPEYARAVIMLGHGHSPPRQIERRLEVRLRRQQIFERARPPRLWMVIDEAALRRPIGGALTMFAQLRHLITLCDMSQVTIQVLPFHAAGHVAAGGPVTMLRMREPELPDVVYLEQLTSALYPDRPAEVVYYRDIMNRLATEAEPPHASPAILHRIFKEL
jgi:transcriptional regulator with XRE-family HTH domain